jgi:hypothetical protein
VLSGRICWTGHGPIWLCLCRPGGCRWFLFCRCHRRCDARETRRVVGSARVEVICGKNGVARSRAVVGSGTRRSYVAFFRIARSGAPSQGLRFCVFGPAWGGVGTLGGCTGVWTLGGRTGVCIPGGVRVLAPSEDAQGSGPLGCAQGSPVLDFRGLDPFLDWFVHPRKLDRCRYPRGVDMSWRRRGCSSK